MDDSLKKSHKKMSNFKLSLICIIGIIAISIFWVGLIILNSANEIGLIMVTFGCIFSLLAMYFIIKFVR